MSIRRLVSYKQAKENALNVLHAKLAKDTLMGRGIIKLTAKIKKIESA